MTEIGESSKGYGILIPAMANSLRPSNQTISQEASLLFRQEIQLSGIDAAKVLLILLWRQYMGAGNNDIGRCLKTSPAWV